MDFLVSTRLAWHPQLIACRNGARMTTGGLDGNGVVASEPNDADAVTALQQALADLQFLQQSQVDGVFGIVTAQAVIAFKQAENLQPQDGVASIGTLTNLDQHFRHELMEAAAQIFSATPFDPGARTADRQEVDVGIATCAFQNATMVEAGYFVAFPVPQALAGAWSAAGGPLSGPGMPHSAPFQTPGGRTAQTFAEAHMVVDSSGAVTTVPRDFALVADGASDLGDPLSASAPDPTTQAILAQFERGVAVLGVDDASFALPKPIVDAWRQAATSGQPLGLPLGLGAAAPGEQTSTFAFQSGALSLDPGTGTVSAAPASATKRYFFLPSASRHLRAGVAGTRATPFVGGDTALPNMLDAISRAGKAGTTGFVYMANWHCDVDLQIQLAAQTTTLGAELLKAINSGCQVRALLWSGLAGLQVGAPIVGPLQRFLAGWLLVDEVKVNNHAQSVLTQGGASLGDVKVALDDRTLPWGSAHQKVLIAFDGQVLEAWVGGIEWNADRLLSPASTKGQPLFDCIARLEGPGAFEVMHNWLERWTATTTEVGLRGDSLAAQATIGSVATQVTNTYGPGCPYPVRVTTAADAIENALRQAKSFFYIEDQYLTGNTRLGAALLTALVRNQATGILIITNDDIDDQPDGKRQRQRFLSDLFVRSQGRLHIYERLGPKGNTLVTDGLRAYVHSKVVIVDDDLALVGSVNSNHRCWSHDTEIMVTLQDANGPGGTQPGQRGFARELRCQLWAQHIAVSPTQLGDASQDIPLFLSRAGVIQGGSNALSFLRPYDTNTSRPLSIQIPILGLALQPLVDAAFSAMIDPS